MPTSHIKEVSFSKYQGAGNDFIIIDDFDASFPYGDAPLIRRLCNRQLGVGADGLILIRNSRVADYKMLIFNCDGFEASMCGNGLRCVVKYLYQLYKQRCVQIESAHGLHFCSTDGNLVTSSLGTPVVHELHIPLEGGYDGHFIDTGVPHAVVFSNQIQDIDFEKVCRKIRSQERFSPQGVNVNFVQITSPDHLMLRTYERGVEAETLACGTGAAAAAVAAYHIYGFKNSIKISCQSQETLVCVLEESLGKITDIFLQGPAQHVFNGKVALYLL